MYMLLTLLFTLLKYYIVYPYFTYMDIKDTTKNLDDGTLRVFIIIMVKIISTALLI